MLAGLAVRHTGSSLTPPPCRHVPSTHIFDYILLKIFNCLFLKGALEERKGTKKRGFIYLKKKISSCSVAQGILELMILLPQAPKSWVTDLGYHAHLTNWGCLSETKPHFVTQSSLELVQYLGLWVCYHTSSINLFLTSTRKLVLIKMKNVHKVLKRLQI